MANQLVNKGQQKTKFSMFLSQEGVKNLIKNSVKDDKSFISSLMSAVSQNPQLAQCDQASILSAALTGASLGLQCNPTLGQFYLVPFNDRKNGRVVATFVLGYKGLLQLAIRSGYYERINVVSIKEGEYISYDPLTEEFKSKIITDDIRREQTPTIGYYAMFRYSNGFLKTIYWSKDKMQAHALTYSKGYSAKKGYTFWEKDFDAMAQKTMLRQLLSKWGILSVELQNALIKDEKVIDVNGDVVEISEEVPELEAPKDQKKIAPAKVAPAKQQAEPVEHEEPNLEEDYNAEDGYDAIEPPTDDDPLK